MEERNTDWVQAQVLKLITVVCYDDCGCYGNCGFYSDTNALFLHAGPTMFNKGEIIDQSDVTKFIAHPPDQRWKCKTNNCCFNKVLSAIVVTYFVYKERI